MKKVNKESLFYGLSKSDLEALLKSSEIIDVEKEKMIIREGESESSFYYVVEGSLRIVKNVGEKEHVIAKLGEGESIGEMILVDHEPRSASVIAETKCKLYRFDVSKLMETPELTSSVAHLRDNIHKKIALRLRSTNEVTLEALKNKYIMSVFFIRLVSLLAVYTLSLNLIEKAKAHFSSTTFLSVGLIIVFAIVLGSIIKKSGYPYSFYGLTLKKAWSITGEAILFTLPVLALVVLLKWLAITQVTAFNGIPLFDHTAIYKDSALFTWGSYFVLMFFYACFCPIQEFIVRGCVQSPLQFLLEGSEASVKWKAILISNLLFASVHSHTSFGFAMSTFIPGIFWGWMYARQRSLIGVSVSHVMVGVWAAFIVGFENLMR